MARDKAAGLISNGVLASVYEGPSLGGFLVGDGVPLTQHLGSFIKNFDGYFKKIRSWAGANFFLHFKYKFDHV